MRLLTIATLAGAVVVTACARVETASASMTTTAAAAPATTGTTGAVDTATSAGDKLREITIPAGTVLPVALDTSVASDTSRVEQPVNAHLTRPLILHGQTALPSGTRISGVVTDAKRSGKVKGLAHVAMRFESLVPTGSDERYRIHTSSVGRTAQATKKKDALEIGAPAAGGALVGAIVGGKKGALVGTAVGGGAGTAVVLSTRGKEVRLPRGTALRLKLTEPVTVRVRG
jgi:hypothetical protein